MDETTKWGAMHYAYELQPNQKTLIKSNKQTHIANSSRSSKKKSKTRDIKTKIKNEPYCIDSDRNPSV